MARPPSVRSSFSLLLILAVMGVMLTFLRERAGPPVPPPADPEDPCGNLQTEGCGAPSPSATSPAPGGEGVVGSPWGPGSPALPADSVCRNVGYLCAELDRTDSLRILRWPLDTPIIRVWVPRPTGVPPSDAQTLQRAAVSGMRIWHEIPFPLEVSARSVPNDPHIRVEWSTGLGSQRLGHTQLRWRQTGEAVEVEIPGLFLASHNPSDPSRPLTPEQIRLVAAHEMGHALGLPHSDDPRDVMFPQNTAWRRTRRDFQTMEALYRLPNGALVRR